MNKTVKRIYTPISADSCMTTPYAMVNGKKSYMPLPEGAFEVELTSTVLDAGGLVDPNYSLVSSQKGHSEEGQIELTLKLPDTAENPAKSVVRIGLYGNSLPIFGVSVEQDDAIEVSGTFGELTLAIIAGLANRGTALKINGAHFDADDDKHFTGRMTERQFSHDGTSAGDKNILYPKSMADDQQTTIRVISNLDVYLDGFGFLEIPLYKGVEVRIILDTTYVK
jgi:hypothetical protein